MLRFQTEDGADVWLKRDLIEAISINAEGEIRVYIDIKEKHYFTAIDTYGEIFGEDNPTD